MVKARLPINKKALAAAQLEVRKTCLKEQRKQKLVTKATILAAVAPGKDTGYNESLIGQEENSRLQASFSTRQSGRQSWDVTINKCLRDNFSDFSSAEVDLVMVDGMSLRDTLKRDKALQKIGQLTMGKYYYQELRNKFRKVDDGKSRLAVKDQSEICPPDLWNALDMLAARTKKCQPLHDWFEATCCSTIEDYVKFSGLHAFILELHVVVFSKCSDMCCWTCHSNCCQGGLSVVCSWFHWHSRANNIVV
jgi:hypothetical protein